MGMDWYKQYVDARHHPKFTLGCSQQMADAKFLMWTDLMSYTAKHISQLNEEAGGVVVPWSAINSRRNWRTVSANLVQSLLASCTKDGLIVHDFCERNAEAIKYELKRRQLKEKRQVAGKLGGIASAAARANLLGEQNEGKQNGFLLGSNSPVRVREELNTKENIEKKSPPQNPLREAAHASGGDGQATGYAVRIVGEKPTNTDIDGIRAELDEICEPIVIPPPPLVPREFVLAQPEKPSAQPKKPKERQPRSFMTESWEPKEKTLQKFQDQGYNPQSQVDKFRNYFMHKGQLGANWDAAFSNWCLNAIKYKEMEPAKVVTQPIYKEFQFPKQSALTQAEIAEAGKAGREAVRLMEELERKHKADEAVAKASGLARKEFLASCRVVEAQFDQSRSNDVLGALAAGSK